MSRSQGVGVDISRPRAEALVGAGFPSLSPVRASALEDEGGCRAFDVNGAWIFRFPRDRAQEAALAREVALTARLAPFLPLSLPLYEAVGAPSPEYPFRFAGYGRLSGVLALHVPPERVRVGETAALLGEFLSRLHEFPLAEAEAMGVLRDDSGWNLAKLREGVLSRFAALRDALPEPMAHRCWKLFSRDEGGPPRAGGRLVHSDLGAEHLLVDPSAGRPLGTLDWSDAVIGDPAVDFAGLYTWLGEPLLQGVLERYTVPFDEGLPRRARFIGVAVACLNLLYGLESSRGDYVAFGRRSLDRALSA